MTTEHWRPQFHFCPESGWMNDPNGLVLRRVGPGAGYHLYYQHVPSDDWTIGGFVANAGRVRWGHARSPDLVRWRRRGVALDVDDDDGAAFSGCAVIDIDDTSGLGLPDATVLLFTRNRTLVVAPVQTQHVAVTTDGDAPVMLLDENPVLEPDSAGAHVFHFRDPKVRWFQPEGASGFWVMVLAAFQRVLFYRSDDLRDWRLTRDLALYSATALDPALVRGPFVECPDLLLVPGADGEAARWVLVFSEGHPPGIAPTGSRYLFGEFDGDRFLAEIDAAAPDVPLADLAVPLDRGPDFYAPQSWFVPPAPSGWLQRFRGVLGAIAGRLGLARILPRQVPPPVLAGWLNNWAYAEQIPTDPWRGQLSIPRVVTHARIEGQRTLLQQPHRDVESLREAPIVSWDGDLLDREVDVVTSSPGPQPAVEWDVELAFFPRSADRVGITVRADGASVTRVVWVKAGEELAIERSAAGSPAGYEGRWTARLAPDPSGLVRLRLLIDRSSIEAFGGRGEVALSALFLPSPPSGSLRIFAEGGTAEVDRLRVYPMSSIWGGTP